METPAAALALVALLAAGPCASAGPVNLGASTKSVTVDIRENRANIRSAASDRARHVMLYFDDIRFDRNPELYYEVAVNGKYVGNLGFYGDPPLSAGLRVDEAITKSTDKLIVKLTPRAAGKPNPKASVRIGRMRVVVEKAE